MTIKITWYGQSAFGLEADGKSVLIDPFLSGNPVHKTDPTSVNPGTILLTHAHNDHVGDTIDIAKRAGSTVIATPELAKFIGSQGVENVTSGNHGGTVDFDGGTAKFTPAWHTSSYDLDGQVMAPGVPVGYIVRFGGKTMYFAGDTSLFMDMQLIGEEKLDLATIPIGDRFTMGPRDAVKAAKFLRAATVIPCHYNTFPAIEQDPNAFKLDVERETDSKVLILQPGENTLT